MKIIFHPSFDSGYYLKLRNASSIGTAIVGTVGLLEYLSLHNGLSGIFASDGERAARYLSHVSKFAEGSMIENAFKNDALGVAKCLLQWRDLLIMAGWKPSQRGNENTPKLQLLSKIETSWNAQVKGLSDRWRALADLAGRQALIEKDDSIKCKCPREVLPRVIQDVLQECHATYATIPENVQIPEDADINIVHYNNLSDAYRQIAANIDDYKETVIINRDNVSLNHTLFSWGRPLVGASIKDSNPITLQFFKLAMSVFSRPLNIQNILSYLQLPVGPVPRRLRSALANVLIADGGFGTIDWNEIHEDKIQELKKAGVSTNWEHAIYDYINGKPENTTGENLNKAQRESRTTFLKYITDTSLEKGKNIPVTMLREYIGAINKWASGITSSEEVDDMLKAQLCTVVSYFKQLTDTLEGISDISYQDLEKHVRTIYQPTTIIQAHAQVGALNVIDNCNQLLDTPDNLIWLDCCGADEPVDQYEFLSNAERTWLNNQEGIIIPRLQNILSYNRIETIMSLSNVKGKVTLVSSSYYQNQKMAEHPIIAELKMRRGDELKISEGTVNVPLSQAKDIHRIEPSLMYKIDKIEYQGRNESNTSIDTLINYPFDYTVHYIARLGEMSTNEIGSVKKITGLVAHSFIESLVESVSGLPEPERISTMSQLLDQEYDTRLEKAVNSTGLSLLLKENEVEYNNLHFQLRRSIEVLITIMQKQQLVPIGCEIKYEEPLGDVINEFNARIDMELKDKQGHSIIFDFKWSYSNYYGNKIKDGKAIQLELYRKELEQQGKNVSAVGYYLLPKCVLETSDYPTLKDDKGRIIIHHIKPAQENADIFSLVQNSVRQRLEEIRDGEIEEGEGMDITNLPYSQKIIRQNNMLKVGTSSQKADSIKKESQKVFTDKPQARFLNAHQSFKDKDAPLNEQPTTYPLMKGRLK